MRFPLLLSAALPLLAFAQDHGGAVPAVHADALVKWVPIGEAQKAALADGKPLMVDMWTPWCGWCKKMDAATFRDEQTAAYINANFHPVSFNAEGPDTVYYNDQKYINTAYDPKLQGGRNGTHPWTQAVAAANGGIGYPTIVYIAADGTLIGPDPGFKSPEDIEPVLRYVREGAYKTMSFADFRATFKTARTGN
jgi:thioredoxin-related protein